LIRAVKAAWKRQRLIMNPTFSSAKLKEMGPLMIKCVDRLVTKMNNDENIGEVNFHMYLKRFTMDTIWNCAFGLDIDLQNDLDNIYFKKSEAIFSNLVNFNPLFWLSVLFHELDWLLRIILNISLKLKIFSAPNLWLANQIDYLLIKRFEQKTNKRDYMQLLLESRTEEEIIDNNNDTDLSNMVHEKKLSPKVFLDFFK